MPFKCVVPGCRSNYYHVKGTRSIPMMRFPLDPVMVDAWVQAIHRPGFIPTQHSHVCIKHFPQDQQIWKEYYRQPDGTYRNVTRRFAKLSASAVPSIFDVDPSQWRMRSRPKHPSKPTKPSPKSDSASCEIITGYKVQFKPEMWEDEPEEKKATTSEDQPPPVKRKRGRPRKHPPLTTEPKTDSSNTEKIDYVFCCALACTNTSETHIMNSLPRDPHLKDRWIEKIDRLYWTPDDDSALCEVHFEEEMWNNNEGEQRILKLGAIPSLFLHGEAIKSWVTLDNSSPVLVENQDSNDVIEVSHSESDEEDPDIYVKREALEPQIVSHSESDEEDPDIYVKREALEPQIDMVEGVEDVLSHNDPDSTGEQFETIYCDTTYNQDEDSEDEPYALHIKDEPVYDESLIQELSGENPFEADSFVQDSMNDNDITLIQDDQVTSGKLKPSEKPDGESNYFVISQSNYKLKKAIRRRKSSQLTDEFQCPVCFKKLSRKKNLDIHMQKLHKNGELSDYQKRMLRINRELNENGILKKHLQFKKPPPALKPIGSNCIPSSPSPVESSTLPIPALKPILPSKMIVSSSSSNTSTTPSSISPMTVLSKFSNFKETSSHTPTLIATSASSPLLASSSSIPTLLATSSSIPTFLATSSSISTLVPTSTSTSNLLSTHSSTPSLLATNSSNPFNSNIPTLLATSSTNPTLIATSAVVANPCHNNDPSPSGGRLQNQFLLLLPKSPNPASKPFDQQVADDSQYTIDLSKVPAKQREKLKDKIKEMLNAVLTKSLDPGRIIIAYDRT